MEMERMKKLGKKKIINAAALGLSLLMAPSLVAGSALTAYASPTITADEQNAIDAFLATHPVDGIVRQLIQQIQYCLHQSHIPFLGRITMYLSSLQKIRK